MAYPLNILIADSHADELKAIKAVLSGLGYEPGMATTSADVARMAGTRKYDVVLVDIGLPGLEEMLEAPGGRPLIVGMSGTPRLNFKEACLVAMMDHMISKPMDRQELLLQLKACSVLAGRCRIREKVRI